MLIICNSYLLLCHENGQMHVNMVASSVNKCSVLAVYLFKSALSNFIVDLHVFLSHYLAIPSQLKSLSSGYQVHRIDITNPWTIKCVISSCNTAFCHKYISGIINLWFYHINIGTMHNCTYLYKVQYKK